MPTPLLRINAFTLDWINSGALGCNAGEITALSGDSGSGKSRLLRAIADLDPNELEMALANEPRSDMPAPTWRLQAQYLAAEPVWWTDTAGEMLSDETKNLAPQIGITAALLNKPINHLSTGERQRCALLRALSVNPQVLLLDEPTAALDKTSVGQVEALLKAWVAESARAIIWVSHDPKQRDRIAGQQWEIINGEVRLCP